MCSTFPIYECLLHKKCSCRVLLRRVFRLLSGRLLVLLIVTMTCVLTLLVLLTVCFSCPQQVYVRNLNSIQEFTPKNSYINFTWEHRQISTPLTKQSNLSSPQKQLPHAIIIGVKKSGTRALLEFLRIHPDVRAPGPEPHFFDKNYHRGLNWYRKQMPTSLDGQITMEKTPSYFITKEAPVRIWSMSPYTKLLVVVRDPVTRALSDYTQAASKRADIKPFEQLAFINNHTGIVDTSWGAVKIGVYAKHLEKWLKYFSLRQMHFVNGEKLITEPASEMAKVQAFLGLKPVISEKHFYFNTTKGFPCLKKPEHSGNPHCLGRTKGRSHPEINPLFLKRLRTFYKPFNQKFYQMVGQDFNWDE